MHHGLLSLGYGTASVKLGHSQYTRQTTLRAVKAFIYYSYSCKRVLETPTKRVLGKVVIVLVFYRKVTTTTRFFSFQ